MRSYYIIVKTRTYMCNRFGQGRHVGQNKCPLRSAQAHTRTHAQYQK